MQDDPDLKGMIGSLVDNPDEIQAVPSGPNLIDIDEISGLKNSEVPMP
jgi:hypothetical protein